MSNFEQGIDMFNDYVFTYGKKQAIEICNRYLDMQLFTNDPLEVEFCQGLHFAVITK